MEKQIAWTDASVAIVVDNAGSFQYTATVPADGEVLTPTFTRLEH